LLKKAIKKPHHLPHFIYWKSKHFIIQSYFKLTRGTKSFKFQGHTYHYFCNNYNTTWNNERIVEVPIVRETLRNCHGKILEVGNVLSHYYPVTHDVLDKYEKGKGIINQDIVDFHPTTRYDVIVSISTLEHVGWDENPKDPKKVLTAIENLTKNCLTRGGIMITTVPLGHNPELDNIIKQGCTDLGNHYFLKRLSKENIWKETDLEDVKEAKYDFPFQRGNAIVVSIKK